jgi:hypothetical protein
MSSKKYTTTQGEFTFEVAFCYQVADITKWAKKLNTDSYSLLLAEVIKRNNEGYDTPYQVFRGNDLTNIVLNMYNN